MPPTWCRSARGQPGIGNQSARVTRDKAVLIRPRCYASPASLILGFVMESEQFRRVVEGLDHAALLVTIAGLIGPNLRSHLTAEDILQSTLEMAWRDHRAHGWVDPRTFRAWLIGIARNRVLDAIDCLNAQKRGGRQTTKSLDETGMSQHEPFASTTPSRIAIDRERATHIESALATLPPEQEVLLRGHLFQQRPMSELAAELGLNLATAWSRFRRGATQFRRELQRRLQTYAASSSSSSSP